MNQDLPEPVPLILRNDQALGDAVMLSAAVRDLHASYPGRFRTAIRSSCPAVWENNPFVIPEEELDARARVINCRYPLVEHSNRLPYHFIHGFIHWLNRELRLAIRPTAFHGDIHLSTKEQAAPTITEQLYGSAHPYWVVVAGGKSDYTIKWWSTARYQAVVDHFRTRICFVQVGDVADAHAPLRGVVDLRGRTTQRELIKLMHHAQGVLCPVTSLMHLAAAVPLPAGSRAPRACVVVAGGREPSHWEAYPTHQFMHTIGMLPCCAFGGCWRSRTVPLLDGSEHDLPENICDRPTSENLPECMDMITADAVIQRIHGYLQGGLRPFFKGSAERLRQLR